MHLTVCSYHVTYAFHTKSTLFSYLNVKRLLARNRCNIWSLSDCNGTRIHKHLISKETLNHLAKLPNGLSCILIWVLICTVRLTVCFYHVTYVFQSESRLYRYVNVKELSYQNRPDIGSLIDCNTTQTYNHLVCKRALYHLAELAKGLSCAVSTYLYEALDFAFLSSHVHILEWIHTPLIPKF